MQDSSVTVCVRVQLWQAPQAIGTWTTLIIGVKLSRNPNEGWIEIYHNGKLQKLTTGMLHEQNSQSCSAATLCMSSHLHTQVHACAARWCASGHDSACVTAVTHGRGHSTIASYTFAGPALQCITVGSCCLICVMQSQRQIACPV